MTPEKAIMFFKTERQCNARRGLSSSELEVFDTAIEALEKRIPKKPDIECDGYSDGELVYDTWVCPNCGTHYEIECDKFKHCPDCGQKIDWSDEE